LKQNWYNQAVSIVRLLAAGIFFAACDNPAGNSGLSPVFRGGSWFSVGFKCAASFWSSIVPSVRVNDLGFRVSCP
jgi:formylglycine-generating enzyme required for sulfatase activity